MFQGTGVAVDFSQATWSRVQASAALSRPGTTSAPSCASVPAAPSSQQRMTQEGLSCRGNGPPCSTPEMHLISHRPAVPVGIRVLHTHQGEWNVRQSRDGPLWMSSEEAGRPWPLAVKGTPFAKQVTFLWGTWRPFDYYFPKRLPSVPWGNPEPTDRQGSSPESTVPVCAGLATSGGKWTLSLSRRDTHVKVPSHTCSS